MRRRLLVSVASALWLVLILFNLANGTQRARPGDDALARIFAEPSAWFAPVRQALMTATAHLPLPGGALLPGLTTGDTSRVSESLDAAMKASSLTHLTAVSGANCQIIVAVVFFVLSWLGAPRWLRILGAVVSLVAFVALVTPAASVSRAAVMSLAVLMGLFLGRLRGGVPVLALSVIVLLGIEPRWSIDYGFALSVCATAGLLWLSEPFAAALAVIPGIRRFGHSVRLVIAVPIAASVACQPVLILLSPTLSTYGLIANILTVPAAGVGTIAGLIVCVLALAWPAAAGVIAWIAWLPAQWIGIVAEAIATWPLARLPFFDSVVGFVASLVLSIATIALVVNIPTRVRISHRLIRLVAGGIVLLSLTASVYAGVLSLTWRRFVVPDDWSIAACDVGQGDAFLVRSGTPTRGFHYALIDTGRSPEKLRSCLDRLGVDRIDLMVLTHYDLDHVGGTEAVIGRVVTALVGTESDMDAHTLVTRVRDGGASIVFARAGQSGTLGDSPDSRSSGDSGSHPAELQARWTVLWPDGSTPNMQVGNPGSVAMLWNIGPLSAVFLADLGADAQDMLRSRYVELARIDVLKVAHHGSADTSEALTNELHPRVALISVGADNGYGHPTSSVLARFAQLGTLTARTDRQGMLFVSADSVDRLTVSTER